MADELLTQREVAEMLKVAVRTLERWRQDGSGPPFVRVGPRAIRYRRTAVEQWLEANPETRGADD